MENILSALKSLVSRLAALGYDEVKWAEAKIKLDGTIYANVYLEDEFQNSVDYGEKIRVGVQPFYFEDGTFIIPSYFTGREMRELEVLVKRLGKTKELTEKMTSAAGREFAQRLTEDLGRFRLLRGWKEEEVPF